MAIIDSLLKKREEEEELVRPQLPSPVAAPNTSWVKELIDKRYQPKTERLKRTPVGFNFTREPFDPSSFYNQLNTFKNINVAATNVAKQEAQNKEEARLQREFEASQAAMQGALGGVDPRFTYNSSGSYNGKPGKYKYKLGGVTSNTAKAADYFGNKYGIKNIGGYRSHGSVPGSDHPKGRALDYMTRDVKKGNALANDLIKNANAWNVKYVIWNRYIWQPSSGWRKYSGPSPHTDHVHASFHK